jgi:hypothetical protein
MTPGRYQCKRFRTQKFRIGATIIFPWRHRINKRPLVWRIVSSARVTLTNDAMIDRKPQPEPSAQEVLAGLIERVTYHDAEIGFCKHWIASRDIVKVGTLVAFGMGRLLAVARFQMRLGAWRVLPAEVRTGLS